MADSTLPLSDAQIADIVDHPDNAWATSWDAMSRALARIEQDRAEIISLHNDIGAAMGGNAAKQDEIGRLTVENAQLRELLMQAATIHYDGCELQQTRRLQLVTNDDKVCTCDAFGVWHQIQTALEATLTQYVAEHAGTDQDVPVTKKLADEIARLTAELNDIEQCHANDHARNGDLIAEVDRLTAELAACRAELERDWITEPDTVLHEMKRFQQIERNWGAIKIENMRLQHTIEQLQQSLRLHSIPAPTPPLLMTGETKIDRLTAELAECRSACESLRTERNGLRCALDELNEKREAGLAEQRMSAFCRKRR